jgi:hypothetical protein
MPGYDFKYSYREHTRRGEKVERMIHMSGSDVVSPVNDVIDFFARAPSREDIMAFQLSPAARDRIQELLTRNAEGLLTADEQRELDQVVLLDDILSLIRARAHGSRISGMAG